MPYPSLPPEIPPIVKSVVTESVSSDNDINSFKPSLKNTIKSRSKSSQNSRLLSVLKSANSSNNSDPNSQQQIKLSKSLVGLELTDENIQSIDINNHAENSLTEKKESLLARLKKHDIETVESLSDNSSTTKEIDQSLHTWQPDKVKKKEQLNHHNLLNKLRQNNHTADLQIINTVETTSSKKGSENLKDLADLDINSQLPADNFPSLKSSNSPVKSQKSLPDTVDFENDPLTNYSNSHSNSRLNSFQTNNLDQNIQPIKPPDQLTGDRPSARNSVVN
ncbi:MAG: hypothetical protein ACRDB1_04250, partial [Microcoleaceae cyanobacterium]